MVLKKVSQSRLLKSALVVFFITSILIIGAGRAEAAGPSTSWGVLQCEYTDGNDDFDVVADPSQYDFSGSDCPYYDPHYVPVNSDWAGPIFGDADNFTVSLDSSAYLPGGTITVNGSSTGDRAINNGRVFTNMIASLGSQTIGSDDWKPSFPCPSNSYSCTPAPNATLTAPTTPGVYSVGLAGNWNLSQVPIDWAYSSLSFTVCPTGSTSVTGGTTCNCPTGDIVTGTGASAACTAPTQSATCSISAPSSVTAGQTFSATITANNTGTATWTSAANYKLGAQGPQDNTIWGTGRVLLPSTTAPGLSATFTSTFTAPATLGLQSFDWQMLQENVAWFGSECTSNITVTVPPPSAPVFTGSCSASDAATANWSATGATYYETRIYNEAMGAWTGTCSSASENGGQYCNNNATATSDSWTGIAGDSYSVWGAACNAGGCTPNGTGGSVLITCPAAAAPTVNVYFN
jgi:hypothetical protein